ncbi:hypothetical protein [Nitrosopumilus sp.]|uniref:hypothetical protein n=1 Tax=Nitrosopumilus sp. TaxID=2024843 RepID=UPI003B58D42E
MNRKTAYLIPAIAVVFALMFSVASPLAMAEYGEGMHDRGVDQKHKKMHKVIKVEGFVGSIQITEDSDRQTIREQVTVSLSEAAQGLDVRGGHIGVVANENGDKFLAWILKSIDRDSESETVIATIYVVDAGDASNTATVTKEFAHSKMNGKFVHDDDRQAKIAEKLERFSHPTGDAEIDAVRATFVEKLQELKEALDSGDSQRASEIREELQDLRSELGNIKSYRK